MRICRHAGLSLILSWPWPVHWMLMYMDSHEHAAQRSRCACCSCCSLPSLGLRSTGAVPNLRPDAPAVGLEYTDAAQQLNAAAAAAEAEVGPPEEWSEAPLPPLPDITSDAVRGALLQLQQLLHVGGGGSGSGGSTAGPAEATAEGLQRAHAMLEACVLPALAEASRQQQQQQAGGGGEAAPAAAATQRSAAAAMLARYPLGFSTGDGGADLAASILRMLYIKDLRELQASPVFLASCSWLPVLLNLLMLLCLRC